MLDCTSFFDITTLKITNKQKNVSTLSFKLIIFQHPKVGHSVKKELPNSISKMVLPGSGKHQMQLFDKQA
ncbi:hypothetical protein T06_15179 [Trichinella sp. T6]|nr:hypothetical protein T06_15179 [Trichinella sp. T6]